MELYSSENPQVLYTIIPRNIINFTIQKKKTDETDKSVDK